jgi:hypothetical protein
MVTSHDRLNIPPIAHFYQLVKAMNQLSYLESQENLMMSGVEAKA